MTQTNNIRNHISDDAASVKYGGGTGWPTTIKTVEQALDNIGPWAMVTGGLPISSKTLAGIIRIATDAEAAAGTVDNVSITPKQLKTAMATPQASETIVGNTRYATQAEALAGTLDTAAVTPKKLVYTLNNYNATEARRGTLAIATKAAAEAGTADNVTMTPLKVKQAIAALSKSWGPASETFQGVVKQATIAEARAGVLRDGIAISPWVLQQMTATEAQAGVAKLANNAQMAALTDRNVVVSPGGLGTLKATGSQFGLVKLLASYSTQANTALSANSPVLYTTGGNMSGNITFTENRQGISWARNTDFASIRFKNDSDADTDSFLEFSVGDNSNEYFRWSTQTTGQTSPVVGMTLRPGGELWLAGVANVHDFYLRSDRRLKSNFVDIVGAVGKVNKLSAVTYDKQRSLTDATIVKREAGLIAQEIEQLLPEAVITAEDGTKSIAPAGINALLVAAVKELSANQEVLMARIRKLEEEK